MVLGASLMHARVIADPPYPYTGTFRFVWGLAFLSVLVIATYGAGLPDQPRSAGAAAGAAVAASATAAIAVSLAQLVVGDALLPRFVVFTSAGAAVPLQVAVATAARRSALRDRDRLLLVAPDNEVARLLDDLPRSPERDAVLAASLHPAEAGGPGTPLVDAVDASAANVLVLERSALLDDRIIDQAATLHERGVRVRTLLGCYEEWLGKLPLGELERTSLFFDIGELHGSSYARVKRVADVAAGLAGLLTLALATPLVLAGNLVANRGPLFYRQPRVGKGGRIFTILKFRTMRPDATSDQGTAAGELPARWTQLDDPRVTPFGRVLRRTHLDELPQVWNVVRGDLSLVGPRPEQPHYVTELSAKLPYYDLRHLVRPGLTGWAQVKYGYAGDERDALEKLQYEFFYLRHQDLRFDLRIAVRTLRSLVGGEGAGR